MKKYFLSTFALVLAAVGIVYLIACFSSRLVAIAAGVPIMGLAVGVPLVSLIRNADGDYVDGSEVDSYWALSMFIFIAGSVAVLLITK